MPEPRSAASRLCDLFWGCLFWRCKELAVLLTGVDTRRHPSSASLELVDYPRDDVLGLRYTSVNFEAEKRLLDLFRGYLLVLAPQGTC